MFKIKLWEDVKPHETASWLALANRPLIKYLGKMIVSTAQRKAGVLSIVELENGKTSVVSIGNLATGEVSHQWEVNQGSILGRVTLVENEQK